MRKRKKNHGPVVYGKNAGNYNSKHRRQKMNSEQKTIELSISRSNIEAALIASGQMQAFGVLNDDENLLDLKLELPDVIPMKVKFNKEQEVEVIRHNG